jgi:hypothetical protein
MNQCTRGQSSRFDCCSWGSDSTGIFPWETNCKHSHCIGFGGVSFAFLRFITRPFECLGKFAPAIPTPAIVLHGSKVVSPIRCSGGAVSARCQVGIAPRRKPISWHLKILVAPLVQLKHAARMKQCFSILLWLLVCSQVFSEDLLQVREWKSSDGAKLSAELVSWDGKVAKLKRAKDGKVFDLEASKLSDDDTALLKETAQKFETMTGAQDLSEANWALASRIGKLDVFKKFIARQQVTGAQEIEAVTLTPQRFIREMSKNNLIVGKYVAIRACPPAGAYLSSGVKELLLMWPGDQTDGEHVKKTIATCGTEFSPRLTPGEVDSCQIERIGVAEYLLFTVTLRSSTPRRP